MAEQICNCLIGLIVGRVLRDKHKRWRLDKDNNRKLEIQSRNGTRPTPTTAHAAAVHRRSPRGSIDSPLEPKPFFDQCGMTMPPGLGFALAPFSASTDSSESDFAIESTSPPPAVNQVPAQSITQGHHLLLKSVSGRLSGEASLPKEPSPLVTCELSDPAQESPLTRPTAALSKQSALQSTVKQQIVMPDRHYRNVHSHYAKVPAPVEHDERNDQIKITSAMQSYEYSALVTNHRVGFNLHESKGRTHKPARKSVDLEELPPLSSAMAKQITHRERIRAQQAIAAKFQKQQEDHAERQRRAKRAQQHQVPPFKMRVGPLYSRNKSESNSWTPLATPAKSPINADQPNVSPIDTKQPQHNVQGEHARWAPNLIQQHQKLTTIVKRRQRPVLERRPSKDKSTLGKAITGSMVNLKN